MAKPRTVTLTNHAPVRIVEEEWPILARHHLDTQGARAHLTVRRHADGRALVYGMQRPLGSGAFERELHAGELMTHYDPAGVAVVIARVAEAVRATALVPLVIADLPVVHL